MNTFEIYFHKKNRTINFDRITFNRFTHKIQKIKINNQEYYSKIAEISGYIRGAMNFNTFEFEFLDFIHIDYLIVNFIEFINYNKKFVIEYDEIGNFLEFLDFIAIDINFINELKLTIKYILMNDFHEFIVFCTNHILIKLIKSLNLKFEKCKLEEYNKYIELKEIKNIDINNCNCDTLYKTSSDGIYYCYVLNNFYNFRRKCSYSPWIHTVIEYGNFAYLMNYEDKIKYPRIYKFLKEKGLIMKIQ